MLPLKRCPRSPSGPHPHVHLVPLFGGSVTDLPGLGAVSSEIYSVRWKSVPSFSGSSGNDYIRGVGLGARGWGLAGVPSSRFCGIFSRDFRSLASDPQPLGQLFGGLESNPGRVGGLQGGPSSYDQLMREPGLSSESRIFLEGLIFIKWLLNESPLTSKFGDFKAPEF